MERREVRRLGFEIGLLCFAYQFLSVVAFYGMSTWEIEKAMGLTFILLTWRKW